MKTGIKTSEFWLSLGSVLSILLAKYLGVDMPPDSILTTISTIVAVYTGGRSIAKRSDG